MDTLLLCLIITSGVCVLLILILCGLLVKIVLNPGSIGQTRNTVRSGSRHNKHRRASGTLTETESDTASPPATRQTQHHQTHHQHHRTTPADQDGAPRGGKLKRHSRGSLGKQNPTSELAAPSPGKIVELGFGTLKSSVKMHMDIGEPNRSDLSFVGSTARQTTRSKAKKR